MQHKAGCKCRGRALLIIVKLGTCASRLSCSPHHFFQPTIHRVRAPVVIFAGHITTGTEWNCAYQLDRIVTPAVRGCWQCWVCVACLASPCMPAQLPACPSACLCRPIPTCVDLCSSLMAPCSMTQMETPPLFLILSVLTSSLCGGPWRRTTPLSMWVRHWACCAAVRATLV